MISNTAFLIAAGMIVVLGAVVFIFSLRGQDEADGGTSADADEDGIAAAEADADDDPSPMLTRTLARAGILKRIQWQLLQAGLRLRPSELVALACGSGGVGFVAGIVLYGILAAIPLGLVCAAMPVAYVYMKRGVRRRAMNGQLAEALSMMASSLHSGYSFLRAMQIVSDEMDPPIAEEFSHVLDELSVGVSQERALRHLYERCPTADIHLVVTACQIQFDVGGNLSEILETAAEMVRERERLHGEIAALTAEGRMSAGILAAIPIFLGIVVYYLNPGYIEPLFSTRLGMFMLGGAGLAMLMGMLVIRKMLAIDI